MLSVLLFILAVNFIIDWQFPNLTKPLKKNKYVIPKELFEEKTKSDKQFNYKDFPKPSDPVEYGMVIDDLSLPQSQEGWDEKVGGKINEAFSGLNEESLNEIKEMIGKNNLRTEEKIQMVDESIKECENQLTQNPNDLSAKSRKEHLMMLKSIANSLK